MKHKVAFGLAITFFRNKKVTCQTPLKINDETHLQCLFYNRYAGSKVSPLVKPHLKS